MDQNRRLGLILPPCDEPWRAYNRDHGFAGIARALIAAGWAVDCLCFAPPCADWPDEARIVPVPRLAVPVIGGPGSAAIAASLTAGYRLWHVLRERDYAAVLAPLGGGLLQPALVSRATGEALCNTAMLLWGEAPTRDRLLADPHRASEAALVDDALERGALALADAVLAPGEAALAGLRQLGARPDACRIARLPGPIMPPTGPFAPGTGRHLAFIGPGNRAHGADRFLDAIEDLAEAGQMTATQVHFLGPWREEARGLSQSLLGLRATGWRFAFTLDDTITPGEVIERLSAPAWTAILAGGDSDDDVLAQALIARGADVRLAADHRLAEAFPALVRDLADAPATEALPAPPTDWPALIAQALRERPVRPECPAPTIISLCITHRDRPAALRAAVASLDDAERATTEIIIADAGSRLPEADAALADLQAASARVLRLGPSRHRAACDAAAQAATGEVLVFLDDDNAFLAGGCARMARALCAGPFDIIVTTLLQREGQAEAIRAFIGEGYSAGLLFNCLGDSSLAIRRTAFAALGGFAGYEGAANDWVFLARARAAGLRIGVLQEPAVLYNADPAAATKWRKRDSEGMQGAILRIGLRIGPGRDNENLLPLLAVSRGCHIG